MANISSFCLLLCLVAAAQSAVIVDSSKHSPYLDMDYQEENDRPIVDTSVKVTQNNLATTTSLNTRINLQPCGNVEPTDQEIDAFAQSTLAKLNFTLENGAVKESANWPTEMFLALLESKSHKFLILNAKLRAARRKIVNGKIANRIIKATMQTSGNGTSVLNANIAYPVTNQATIKTSENEASECLNGTNTLNPTELEKEQLFLNALLKRLQPKSCQKEFIADILVYGEVKKEMHLNCQLEEIYRSEWYPKTCGEIRGEVDFGNLDFSSLCTGLVEASFEDDYEIDK